MSNVSLAAAQHSRPLFEEVDVYFTYTLPGTVWVNFQHRKSWNVADVGLPINQRRPCKCLGYSWSWIEAKNQRILSSRSNMLVILSRLEYGWLHVKLARWRLIDDFTADGMQRCTRAFRCWDSANQNLLENLLSFSRTTTLPGRPQRCWGWRYRLLSAVNHLISCGLSSVLVKDQAEEQRRSVVHS